MLKNQQEMQIRLKGLGTIMSQSIILRLYIDIYIYIYQFLKVQGKGKKTEKEKEKEKEIIIFMEIYDLVVPLSSSNSFL